MVNHLFLDAKENYKWPYSQRRIQGLVAQVCNRANLSRRNPHDLRHTYATILLMNHMSPAHVQKQLGHSSISITVDIYGHWFQGEGRDGLEEALVFSCTKSGRKAHITTHEKRKDCNLLRLQHFLDNGAEGRNRTGTGVAHYPLKA